jgi:hypothetical protein
MSKNSAQEGFKKGAATKSAIRYSPCCTSTPTFAPEEFTPIPGCRSRGSSERVPREHDRRGEKSVSLRARPAAKKKCNGVDKIIVIAITASWMVAASEYALNALR